MEESGRRIYIAPVIESDPPLLSLHTAQKQSLTSIQRDVTAQIKRRNFVGQ